MAERQSAPRTRGNAFQNDVTDLLNRVAVLERRLGNVSGYSGGGGGGATVYTAATVGGLPASAAVGDIGIVDAGTWAHPHYWNGSAWERFAYPVSATPGNQITTTFPDGLYVPASSGGLTFLGMDATDRFAGPSSAAEGFVGQISIAGGLQAGQVAYMEVYGDLYNNTGANQSVTWRLRFGAANIAHTSAANSISTDPGRRRFRTRITIMASSTSAYYVAVDQVATAPSSTEWNPQGANNNLMGGRDGTIAVGSTFDLILSAQWSAANALLEVRGQSAYAYRLG